MMHEQAYNESDVRESNLEDIYLRENEGHEKPHLNVIGAGLMRTGTTSLKKALEILYNKPCYHMSDVFLKHKEIHISKWLDGFRELQTNDSQLTEKFFENIYQGYTSAVDYPTCAFFETLSKLYPNAKIILTTRNPQEWIESCRASTLSPSMLRTASWGEKIMYARRGFPSLPLLHHVMFEHTLGRDLANMSDQQLEQSFIQWNRKVIARIPSERLLIFDPKEGWDPLCKFLNLPKPPAEISFPHLNERATIVRAIDGLFSEGLFFQRLIYGSIVVLIAMLSFLWIQMGIKLT